MKPNLEALRAEIPEYLVTHGFALFRGYSRVYDSVPTVEWDCERFPDYQQFLAVAAKLGVELIIFRDQEFQEMQVNAALEDLEDAEISYEEHHEYENVLRKFRSYVGFTCAIEMTFDYEGTTYSFELRTDWYKDFQKVSEELNDLADDDLDEDNPALGGYFSQN